MKAGRSLIKQRRAYALFLLSAFLFSTLRAQVPAPSQKPLFREAAAEVGLNFRHFTGATGQFFLPEIMGSGAALFDFDGDGDLDILLLQGALLDDTRSMRDATFPTPADWKPGHRLYRNELIPTGRLKYTDVSDRSGLIRTSYGMGAAVADYDNDGYPDLYVTNFGPNFLFHNNGNGTFTDVTKAAGVDDPRWSTSAAFLDYDRDGKLDLFVANYVDFTVKGNKRCYAPTGEITYCAPAAYRPVPSRLFHNEGQGRFVDATLSSGISSSFGPGLGVTCADFNGDGLTDVYVANDGAANLLWINKGNGTFEESGLMAGVAYNAEGVARAGMGVAAGDIDNDGDEDLLVTNLTKEGSTFFLNEGQGRFEDASNFYNLNQPSFLFTGFGVGWFDYDKDGWLDLFAANGAVTLLPSLRGTPYPFNQKNQLFHNEAPKQFFREVTADVGAALNLSEVSRGAAFGDVDNDGDVDVLVANNNGPARLLLNDSGSGNHWLTVKLEGVQDNREGVGARVGVFRKNMAPLWRTAHRDGSYLSAGDIRVHFGLGSSTTLDHVTVHWLNDRKESWFNLSLDRIVTLRQNAGKPSTDASQNRTSGG